MKRVIFSVAATITGLVALLNFKTRPATTAASSSASSGTTATPSATPKTASNVAATSASSRTATVTGTAASPRCGPVQVKVTVSNGKVTSVQATESPTDRPRDVQINSYAI